jgi:hypothetical protein
MCPLPRDYSVLELFRLKIQPQTTEENLVLLLRLGVRLRGSVEAEVRLSSVLL